MKNNKNHSNFLTSLSLSFLLTTSVNAKTVTAYEHLYMSGTTSATIYLGDEARFPVYMQAGWRGACCRQNWVLPSNNVRMEYVSGTCPPLQTGPDTPFYIPAWNVCNANIVATATQLGVLDNQVIYSYYGTNLPLHNIGLSYALKVIPHPISILGISEQSGTAGVDFNVNYKKYIGYYDENALANDKPITWVTPANGGEDLASLGLSFNSDTATLSGAPTKFGVFHFLLHAKTRVTESAIEPQPQPFVIKIDENAYDKPIFRSGISLNAATPEKPYDIDLTSLLRENLNFGVSNMISFKIAEGSQNPNNAWLSIPDGTTHLSGTPNGDLAGQSVTISLIASSNTGGDSSPQELSIQVAQDPAKKPVIADNIAIVSRAGGQIDYELRNDITDPTSDKNLKVTIDKIEQESSDTAPLSLVLEQNTRLHGEVPSDATGQTYTATIHANNQQGGDSEVKQVKIKIVIDSDRKPRFLVENPQFELLKPGLPFFHDFVASGDIFPGYDDAPYTIKFAPGYEYPSWLRLENNKLIADKVPEDVAESVYIYVVVKNRPGGESEIFSLELSQDIFG